MTTPTPHQSAYRAPARRWLAFGPLTRSRSAVLGVVTALAASGCGAATNDAHDAAPRADTAPGVVDRLDPEQAQYARAEAVADRFAQAFAAYLVDPDAAVGLRRAGATEDLVQRITRARRRAPDASDRAGLGSAGVVVRPDGDGGWIAAAALKPRPLEGRRTGEPGLPLTFRLEHRAGRTVVVDVNAGGQG